MDRIPDSQEGIVTKSKKSYGSPEAFLRALTDRLKEVSRKHNFPIGEIRRQIAFERLLARLFAPGTNAPWVLKGGLALELRLNQARVTKDIDLVAREMKFGEGSLEKRNNILRESLAEAARKDFEDFFFFTISRPVIDLDGPAYGGARFRVEAEVDGRNFSKFHLDVAMGDTIIEPLDELKGKDWLEFAGFASVKFLTLSKEQHFAEKIHAYTAPRKDGRPNSRVKDLVDLLLLIEQDLNLKKTKEALSVVFSKRKTHELPVVLPPAPEFWRESFTSMATELGMGKNLDLEQAVETVNRFFVNKVGNKSN